MLQEEFDVPAETCVLKLVLELVRTLNKQGDVGHHEDVAHRACAPRRRRRSARATRLTPTGERASAGRARRR